MKKIESTKPDCKNCKTSKEFCINCNSDMFLSIEDYYYDERDF